MFRKGFLVWFLLGSLLLSLLVFNVPVVSASDFAGGSGTVASPYQISNWTHLNNVRDYLDKNFTLTANLDSASDGYDIYASDVANGGEGWIPIGDDVEEEGFSGTFDGNGKTISDLFIDNESMDGVGLFGVIEYAEISNLGMVDVDVTGYEGVGGLIGASAFSTVEECYATGTVIGTDYVGGLIGGATSGLMTIKNCYATGDVTGDDRVGGLIGYANSETILNCYSTGKVTGTGYYVGGLIGYSEDSTIENCYATGDVIGTSDYVGGLIGYSEDSTIENCYATGDVTGDDNVGGLIGMAVSETITYCYSIGNIEGDDNVGGLIGYSAYSTVEECYATGDVTGSGEYIGGLIGLSSPGIATIKNCYARGDVTGGSIVGGLIGSVIEEIVLNCYSTGTVTGDDNVGGLIGNNDSSTITNCFWDTTTSGTTISDGGTGKTTTEMKKYGTFDDVGWDIEYTNDNINDGYPALGWQTSDSSTWVIKRSVWSIMEYSMRGYINTLGVFTWVIIFTAIIAYTYLKNQSVVIAAAMAIILIAAFSNALIGVETWVNLIMILSLLAFTGLIVMFIIKNRGG